MQKLVLAISSLLIAFSTWAQTISTRELALATPIGSTVEVRLTGHQKPNKIRGQMGILDNTAFNLALEGTGETRSIPFDQLKSLRLLKTPPTPSAAASGVTPQTAAQAIPKGSLIEARFASKRKSTWVRGRLADADGQELKLQIFQAGSVQTTIIQFAEIESFRPVDSLWVESKAAKAHRAIGTGASIALTGAFALVAVIAVMAATGHLGG